MDQLTNVISTDVLVIGGGIAGLCAANKAVDQGADVLIAEKSTASCCGQQPTSGGSISLNRGISHLEVEQQIKTLVEAGEYLNDQEWAEVWATETFEYVQELADWGLPFETDVNGKIVFNNQGGVKCLRQEMCNPMLLGRALDKGAKVLNKMYMVRLLTRDGRVVGAVGFHHQTGEFYVIQSKSTVIATGGCNYKSRRFLQMDCGEGVAMAYNAGAELRNAEFCNTYTGDDKYMAGRNKRNLYAGLENALGEKILDKYPELNTRMVNHRKTALALYREIEAGRGPIYLDIHDNPDLVKFTHTVEGGRPHNVCYGYANIMRKLGKDLAKDKIEYSVMPEFHAGPIKVDLDAKSTLPGLYAAGDSIQNGCAFIGAYEASALPLGSLGFCVTSGMRAGTAAGKAVTNTPEPSSCIDEINQLKKEIFAPLDIEDGYDPYKAIEEIQEVVFKFKNSYIKHKDRLEKALERIEEIKGKLDKVKAKDAHELVRCHEAKSMATCAETLFRASLMRTETRGSNIREDYPERDDENWLNWIIVKKEDDKMTLRTEPVPIEKYKYKP